MSVPKKEVENLLFFGGNSKEKLLFLHKSLIEKELWEVKLKLLKYKWKWAKEGMLIEWYDLLVMGKDAKVIIKIPFEMQKQLQLSILPFEKNLIELNGERIILFRPKDDSVIKKISVLGEVVTVKNKAIVLKAHKILRESFSKGELQYFSEVCRLRVDKKEHILGSLPPKALGVALRQESKGIVVMKVFPSTPAEKYGLKEGDIIIEMDNKKLRTVEEFLKSFEKFKEIKEEKLFLKVKRNKQEIDIEIHIEKALIK